MGRRKIEIQPILDERNRTVTFIKRKAGLFKKAHELAVLCQADVTVLIMGSNNTIYEFSSVDAMDMIEHYQNDKSLYHDMKDPSNFGNYKKKKYVTINGNYNSNNNNNHNGKKNLITRTKFKQENIKLTKEIESDRRSESNEDVADVGSDGTGVEGNLKSGEEEEDEEEEEEEEEEVEGEELDKRNNNDDIHPQHIRVTRSSSKRSRSSSALHFNHDHKKIKLDADSENGNEDPKIFYPLQHQVQRQFHNFNNNLNPKTPLSNTHLPNFSKLTKSDNMSPGENGSTSGTNTRTPSGISSPSVLALHDQAKSLPENKRLSMRPILRVEIPNNNIVSNTSIHSEPSSAFPNNNNSTTNTNGNIAHSGSTGTLHQNKTDNISLNAKARSSTKSENSKAVPKLPISGNNTASGRISGGFSFNNGLPPLFSASSALPPYIATPLQGTNHQNTSSGSTGSNQHNVTSPVEPLSANALKPFQIAQNQRSSQQRYTQNQNNIHQNQQHQQLQQQNTSSILNTGRTSSPTLPDGQMVNGPPTGSLPSKFANDLMIPSPSGSMSMFQDWTLGPNSASVNNRFHLNQLNQSASGYDPTNGNTGLTPYITAGQTPLVNKFFNFTNEAANDDTNQPRSNTIKEEEG